MNISSTSITKSSRFCLPASSSGLKCWMYWLKCCGDISRNSDTMLVTTAGALRSCLSLLATHWITVRSSTVTMVLTSSCEVLKVSLANRQSRQSPRAVVAAGVRLAPGRERTPSIREANTGSIT